MKKKQYFIPQVDLLPYRTDDLCDGGGGGDMNPTSSHLPSGGSSGALHGTPARKLYI